ncbi:MAG: carboxylesterase/lipase family protein [Sulfurifustaceae bacterium]
MKTRLIVNLVSICAAAFGSLALAAPSDPVVNTENGVVRGAATESVAKFLGIPYAAPPVGELRWQPPHPAAGWTGVRDATQLAPHCPQAASPFGLASTTEDCLYLNVYTPAHIDRGQEHRKPVMVWIHGGALVVGQSDDYDPTKFVERGDVVVVTINYRLGALGFLAHPALTAESPDHASGNYGFLDQQAALQWVRRNIDRFGGDPDNVTIFGESAGGLSTHTQLASPLAHGLFHRAIVESGAYQLRQQTLAAAEGLGSGLAGRVGCSDPVTAAACLRALPPQAFFADPAVRAISAPVVDGKVLTQSIGDAFSTGQFNQVPVMEGSNHDEWTLFVALNNELVSGPITPAGYPAAIAGTLGIPLATATFIANNIYPLAGYLNPGAALGALGTDAIFACNSRTAIRRLSQHVTTFGYEFSDPNAPQLFLPPVSFPYKAYHASEIQYLFVGANSLLNATQLQLSDQMVSYWTTFARNGDPNSAATPAWPSYQAATDQLQSFVPPTASTISNFAVDHKCAFWAPGT